MRADESMHLASIIEEVLVACGCTPENRSHSAAAKKFFEALSSVITEAAANYGTSIHKLEQGAMGEAIAAAEQNVSSFPLLPTDQHEVALQSAAGSLAESNVQPSIREISEALYQHIYQGRLGIFKEIHLEIFIDGLQAIGTSTPANTGVVHTWAMGVLSELAQKLNLLPPDTTLQFNLDPPVNLKEDILGSALERAKPQLLELIQAAVEIGFDEGYAVVDRVEKNEEPHQS